MCVVERRTYIHSNGRRDVVEKARRCHHAVGSTLCRYIEYKDAEVARVVETRPLSSRSPPADEIITAGRDGRTQRYRTVIRRSSKRTSTGGYSRNSDSPVDSVSGPSSPLPPTYKEVRPSAPSPPQRYPSARHPGMVGDIMPPDPNRIVRPDGTAVYSRPPSLEAERAALNERPRRSSVSSVTAELDDRPEPPVVTSSFRARRPSKGTVDVGPSPPSSPGLSSLPRVRRNSQSNRTTRFRADTVLDNLGQQARWDQENLVEEALLRQDRQRQQDQEQAQLERNRLEESERRQRIRQSREAESAAMRRAEEASRDRRDALDALEGTAPPPPPVTSSSRRREAELERKMNAEKAQMAREREAAEARRTPTSPRRVTFSERQPGPPPIVHNYGPDRPSSALLERGDRVIAEARRERAVASQRIEEGMAGLGIYDDENDVEGVVDADIRRSASKRLNKERRERERRLRDQGYYK